MQLSEILATPESQWRLLSYGATSVVHSTGIGDRHVVRKRYREVSAWPPGGSSEEAFGRELDCLKLLSGSTHFPRLLGVDRQRRDFYLTHCGTNLHSLVLGAPPPDWLAQIARIAETLREARILYGDIGAKNVCLDGNRISLIDFGASRIAGTHAATTSWLAEGLLVDVYPALEALIRGCIDRFQTLSFGYDFDRNLPRWDAIRPYILSVCTDQNGGTVIDYGSNYGQFSIPVASLLPNYEVLSLESGTMTWTRDARFSADQMTNYHRELASQLSIENNTVLDCTVTPDHFERISSSGMHAAVQLCLSFVHWLPMKTRSDFEEVITSLVRGAAATIVELPLPTPNQHNGPTIVNWYDGRTCAETVIEDALHKHSVAARVHRLDTGDVARPIIGVERLDPEGRQGELSDFVRLFKGKDKSE